MTQSDNGTNKIAAVASVVSALRDAACGVQKSVGQEQSPVAEADEDIAPAEIRCEWRSKPHKSDVHQRVERQGDRAGRIRLKAEVLTNHVRE